MPARRSGVSARRHGRLCDYEVYREGIAPAGIPEEVRRTLVSALEKAIYHPELKAKTEKLGFIVDYKSPAEARKPAVEDYERALVIAEKLGIKKLRGLMLRTATGEESENN